LGSFRSTIELHPQRRSYRPNRKPKESARLLPRQVAKVFWSFFPKKDYFLDLPDPLPHNANTS
jgi:hypothetical protein